MLRSRLLLVPLAVTSFLFTTTSFDTHSTARAGAPATGYVSPASPMLEPRSGHTATLLPDGKVLIAGGMRRNQGFYRSAELYDPATSKFQTTGEMALAREGAARALLRARDWVSGGRWQGPGR